MAKTLGGDAFFDQIEDDPTSPDETKKTAEPATSGE